MMLIYELFIIWKKKISSHENNNNWIFYSYVCFMINRSNPSFFHWAVRQIIAINMIFWMLGIGSWIWVQFDELLVHHCYLKCKCWKSSLSIVIPLQTGKIIWMEVHTHKLFSQTFNWIYISPIRSLKYLTARIMQLQ